MGAFRYKHGDRPLEGYTIQRGAGRGGFGEVYYALSDAGKEVALKAIFGFEQVELRGVSQCMNLKSPHLVTIFDVKYNAEGVPFVIMEYVGGVSLRQLMDESENGLGAAKSAFFLREMAKGLGYLHEAGIVHRDLKPGNVFYENGYVKIGDYGLAKSMSADHRSGQTVTVGTVHYMAPEIGQGKYDRSIDVYALGAVLFEMMTGRVPFGGSSAGEVLMKHLSCELDLSGIEEPFAGAIRKAMAKRPEDRFATAAEMVEAVFGAQSVQESVSGLSPESLSMVAGQMAGGFGGHAGASAARASGGGELARRMGNLGETLDHGIGALFDRMTAAGEGEVAAETLKPDEDTRVLSLASGTGTMMDAPFDPLRRPQRRALAMLTMGLVAILAGALSGAGNWKKAVPAMFFTFAGAFGAASGLVLACERLLPKLTREAKAVRRLGVGGPATALAVVLSALFFAWSPARWQLSMTWLGIAATLMVMDWAGALSAIRPARLSFKHALLAGILGMAFSAVVRGAAEIGLAMMFAASVGAQLLAAWDPVGARRAVMARSGAMSTRTMRSGVWPRAVADYAKAMWVVGMMILSTLGLMMLLLPVVNMSMSAVVRNRLFASGAGILPIGVWCGSQSRRKIFEGWWSYLVRPGLMCVCVSAMAVAGVMVLVTSMRGDELAAPLFMIVLPAVALAALVMLPRGEVELTDSRAGVGPGAGSRAGSGVRLASVSWVPIVGWGLLGPSLAIGLAAAVDVPGMVAAGFFGEGLRGWVSGLFDGFEGWPKLLRGIAGLGATAGLCASAAMLLAGRKGTGTAHLLRGGLGILIVIWGVSTLHRALPQGDYWTGALRNAGGSVAGAVDNYLRAAETDPRNAAVLLAGGMAILVWPRKRAV